MKSFPFIISVGFFLLLTGIANGREETPPVPDTWTVENAVSFAVTNNPDSFIARKRIEEARTMVAAAQSVDYPVIDLSAGYSQTNNPMYSFGNILNQGAFDQSIDFNDPGRTDDLNLKASIGYRLYNGGRTRAEIEAAQAATEMQEAGLAIVHRRLAFEVIKTFHAIVQAKEMVKVRQEALDAISAALDVANARYDAGDLLRSDLLNLELQQSRASENLIQSRHALELTKRSFLNLLGLKEGEVKISTEKMTKQEIPLNIDGSKREELKQLRAREKASLAALKKAQGGRLPTIDAFASYQIDGGLVLEDGGNSWMAGLKMDYRLFDGDRTSSMIAKAKAALQEVKGLIKKTELAINLEIQQAELDYKQARKRVSVTEKMVLVAKEGIRLSRARFKEGVILASDLIDFEMRLSDALARRLAAKARYQVAIANLRRVAGLEQFPTTKE
jgi:outer membrane protein TolC